MKLKTIKLKSETGGQFIDGYTEVDVNPAHIKNFSFVPEGQLTYFIKKPCVTVHYADDSSQQFFYLKKEDADAAIEAIREAIAPQVRMPINLKAEILDKCYQEGEFKLSSGQTSDWYLDLRPLLLGDPWARLEIGEALWAKIESLKPQLIAGPVLGAVSVALAVQDAAKSKVYRHELPGALLVRKTAKKHGKGNLIEGNYTATQKVVIVEDVVTTGATTKRAKKALEKAGLEVVGCFCVVARDEKLLEIDGVPLVALYRGKHSLVPPVPA